MNNYEKFEKSNTENFSVHEPLDHLHTFMAESMRLTMSKETVAKWMVERFIEKGQAKESVDDFETAWEKDESGEDVLVIRLLPYSKRPRRDDEI